MLVNALPANAYKNPTGKRFPILAWYSIRPDSAITRERYLEMADCGFNISFSHFSKRAEVQKALDACRGTGVMQMVTTGDLESNTAEVVNQFKNDEMVAGWFLRDEPVCDGFKALREFKDRILSADDQHCLYLNLLPNYVSPKDLQAKDYRDYVRRFVEEVNLGQISFDNYPIIEDGQRHTSVRSEFYGNLEDAMAVSQASGQPMWAFALSTAHDPYPVATREILRLEVFSNLAYGAQCIQYFTYWNPGRSTWNFNTAPISLDGQRTHVWYLVRSLNKEIQALAPVFLGAKVLDVSHTGETIPQQTHRLSSLPAPFTGLNPNDGAFIVSHMQNGEKNYLLIVNRDLHDAHAVQMERTGKAKQVIYEKQALCFRKAPSKISQTLGPGDYLLFQW